MRVLFYTAVVIAATVANLGQAVRLEAVDCDDYAQIDAFNTQLKPNQISVGDRTITVEKIVGANSCKPQAMNPATNIVNTPTGPMAVPATTIVNTPTGPVVVPKTGGAAVLGGSSLTASGAPNVQAAKLKAETEEAQSKANE